MPFTGKDENKVHVTFLSATPKSPAIEAISVAKQGAEEVLLSDCEVYLSCPDGYGKTKLSNAFIERILKVSATTRNWRTVKVLLSMAEGESITLLKRRARL